jgi:hypothetical protein
MQETLRLIVDILVSIPTAMMLAFLLYGIYFLLFEER